MNKTTNKQTYQQPSITTLQLQCTSLLAGSGASYGSDDDSTCAKDFPWALDDSDATGREGGHFVNVWED